MIIPLFARNWYKQEKEHILDKIIVVDDLDTAKTELEHLQTTFTEWVNNLSTQPEKDQYIETVKEIQHSLDHINASLSINIDSGTRNSQKLRGKRALDMAGTLPIINNENGGLDAN